MSETKVLSLFDGISCGMIALERAEIPVEKYAAFEINKYAIQVSKKNYCYIRKTIRVLQILAESGIMEKKAKEKKDGTL